nr:anaerobic sulfatase maturase [Priestia koreensis]
MHPFHLLVKPTGPICNLNCEYCYYTKKESDYPSGHVFKMSDSILESYIQQYISSQPTGEVTFAWQGGEPTLIGLPFFERAVALQKKYANGKKIVNTLQTNGTLLNDEWCAFLARHQFLVGLSLDGPEHIHNQYRLDHGGQPTFRKVMNALGLLRKHGVEVNILTCVTKTSAYQAKEIYHFLQEQDIEFVQFIPVVDRVGGESVTDWSVEPHMYGEFLINVFNKWIKHDVGKRFVMNIEWALASWMGMASPICIFSETCGNAVVMEHNGNLYSCDHFVEKEHYLGNIQHGLVEAVSSTKQQRFGENKSALLPTACQECEVRFACHGECPKNRFVQTEGDEPYLNYLCPSYKAYFTYIDPYMREMRDLIKSGKPVHHINKTRTSP